MACVMAYSLILYDGVCGLCNRFVRFVLRHDPRGAFRFASLQSPIAGRILAASAVNRGSLETVYVVRAFDPEASPSQMDLLSRSEAVLFVLRELGGVWRTAGFVLRCFPPSIRDWGYRVIAGTRYRIFGRYATCPVPDQSVRNRFLDI